MDSNNNTSLITYKKLLEELEKNKNNHQNNHLLLGNGFNLSLGIMTKYDKIFKKMMTNYNGYLKQKKRMESINYDIELLIEELKEQVKDELKEQVKDELKEQVKDELKVFLKKYIENKIKIDFMKAVNEIVQKEISKIFQKKTENIYLLLKNFDTYFTLNYDPFLYLLLLKFKKVTFNKNKGLVFTNSFNFIKDDLNTKQNYIYTKIKEARKNGILTTKVNNKNEKIIKFSDLTKTKFLDIIDTHFKDENWTREDIEQVYNKILQEEQANATLEVNDGFLKKNNNTLQFEYNDEEQNIYFLHGAFHIYDNKKKGTIQKITATQNASFCRSLEKIINSEDENIVCILTNTTEDKQEQINENDYLKKSFGELGKIEGSIVIFGTSVSDNDQHIFTQINDSKIDTVYISTNEDNEKQTLDAINKFIKNKKIIPFDYMTVNYTNS